MTSSSPQSLGASPIQNAGSPPPDSVLVAKAPSGEILFSNRYAERVVGRAMSEIADDFPMFHLDGRPYSFAERQVPRSISSGEEIVDEEFLGPAADGSRIRYRVSCWPVYDDGGQIVAAVAVTRDVTEQKRQEERLTYLAGLLANTDDAVVAMDDRYVLTVWNKGAESLYGWKASEVIGLHADKVARTNLSDAERTELRRELAESGRWRGEVVVVRKDGTLVDAELVSVALRRQQDGTTGYLTIHRDISDRKRAEQQHASRAREQALVAELGLRALATVDLGHLLDEAVGLVARTLAVEFAGIAEKAADGDAVTWRAGVGWGHGFVGRRTQPDSLVGYTLRRRAPVTVEDMATDGRFKPSAFARAHGIISALSVMIESPDEPFGVLCALSTRRRRFSRSDVSFVQSVANVLASAVERNWAARRLGEVREAERRRIARDLHDEALQELTEAVVQAARGRAAGLDPEAAVQLVSSLQGVSRQLRGAIYDLRLSEEETRPFPERLHALVDVHRAVAVDCDIGLAIADETVAGPLGERGTEVLRIVGEALTNARRHSGARHIHVTAGGSEQGLWVEVTDDGRGFNAARGHSGGDGIGIAGMRERATLLKGHLDIASRPATGTRVRLELGHRTDDERRAAVARILVVEDHPLVREAIAGMFAGEPDLEVVGQAASLAEARALLADIDIAVVDLGLPDGYGGDFIRDLREANPRAQALVLSASLDPAERAKALDCGAADVLDKAADFDKLVDAVRRLRATASAASASGT